MEYKIAVVKALGLLGTDSEATAEKLAEEVNQHIAPGWEFHGGVSLGPAWSFKTPYLFHAMTKRR